MKPDSESRKLVAGACTVLAKNDLGSATKPAPQLYPHQWNWDSAFIAIGLSHLNEERAQAEIKSLLQAQWSNGMIPHIVFNPAAVDYHPGPAYWHTANSGAPRSIKTSGITQPPLLAYAALKVYQNSANKKTAGKFLRDIFPALLRYSRFLLDARDPLRQGLAFICHPWESGMDNAVNWDIPLNSFKMDFHPKFMRRDNRKIPGTQRPSDPEYTRYSYLVQRYAMEKWNQTQIRSLGLFLVQSVVFNVLHLKSLQALSEICAIIGKDRCEIDDRIQFVRKAFETRLWNEATGCYLDIDLKTGRPIYTENISQFIPLFTGVPGHEQAEILISKLRTPDFWPERGWGLCTQSTNSPEFDAQGYWRGPVWINMNWMIIKGLERFGRSDLAQRLAHETLQLVEQNGFYEYFNPQTGEGLGSDSFSWTAALVLDLVAAGYQ